MTEKNDDAGRLNGSRPSIPKKLRFEIFKRDSFTCQYCGRRAPDVVLHCDHIEPVACDGPTDVLNLMTACIDATSARGRASSRTMRCFLSSRANSLRSRRSASRWT